MTTFGTFGIESEFDSYGINDSSMWYDSEDAIALAFAHGEYHTFIYLDDDGNTVRHEADLGPDAVFPQPLGPSVSHSHGPRPITDLELDPYADAGINRQLIF